MSQPRVSMLEVRVASSAPEIPSLEHRESSVVIPIGYDDHVFGVILVFIYKISIESRYTAQIRLDENILVDKCPKPKLVTW